MQIQPGTPIWQADLVKVFKEWQTDVEQGRAHSASGAYEDRMPNRFGQFETPHLRSRLFGNAKGQQKLEPKFLLHRWRGRIPDTQWRQLDKAARRLLKYSLRSVMIKLYNYDAERRQSINAKPPKLSELELKFHRQMLKKYVDRDRDTLLPDEYQSALRKVEQLCQALDQSTPAAPEPMALLSALDKARREADFAYASWRRKCRDLTAADFQHREGRITMLLNGDVLGNITIRRHPCFRESLRALGGQGRWQRLLTVDDRVKLQTHLQQLCLEADDFTQKDAPEQLVQAHRDWLAALGDARTISADFNLYHMIAEHKRQLSSMLSMYAPNLPPPAIAITKRKIHEWSMTVRHAHPVYANLAKRRS